MTHTVASSSTAATAAAAAAALTTSELTKRYGDKLAVDQLSFSVPTGSIFGFLGPNGAGKTTTFAMLCGFVLPTSGSATILGQPLSRIHRLRGKLSALPQDAQFQPNRKVIDSLLFLAELSGLESTVARKEAEQVLEIVGLQDARNIKGKALSHGMAKRFGIAQAFIGRPELVLLDEPTEGLDPRTAHNIRQLIRSLAGRSTVLVSSHNLAEIQDICDHAAIIDKGRLVCQGTIAELTGTDEQVIIELGAGGSVVTASTLSNLSSLEPVKGVDMSSDGRKMRISLRPVNGVPIDTAITEALHLLIDSGVTISAVVRGHGLEERFLELT